MPEKQMEMVQELVKSPITKLKKPRTRTENKPLTKEQVRKVMLAVIPLRDKALLHLGFNTGLRVSEPLTFTQDAIDWQTGTIKIYDEKKNKYRAVMPPLETLALLKTYIAESKPAGKPVFEMGVKTAERIVQRCTLQALGFKRSWHCIRHTYISLSNEVHQDIKVVIENTGDSPATILQYYTHLTPDYRRKATEDKPVYTEKEG
jgi:integrase